MTRLRLKAWVAFELVVVDDEDERVELGEHLQMYDSAAGDGVEIEIGSVTFTEDDTAAALMFYDNLATMGDCSGLADALPYLVEDAKALVN